MKNILKFGWLNRFLFIQPLFIGEDFAKSVIEKQKGYEKPFDKSDLQIGENDRGTVDYNNSSIDNSNNRFGGLEKRQDGKGYKVNNPFRDRYEQRQGSGSNRHENNRKSNNSKSYGNSGIDIGGNSW